MRLRYWLGHAAAVTLALAAGGTAGHAQRSGQDAAGTSERDDARWLDDCRREHSGRDRARYCDLQVQRLTATGHPLSVDGRENGGVEIIGDGGDSIIVRALVEASGETNAAARDLAGQVKVETADGRIRADGPDERHRSWWAVSYRISVPRHIDLTVQTTNGPVSVTGVAGTMDLRAVNGPLTLERVGGDVHVRAENGPLSVTLDGTRWAGTGLDAETRNGPVDLLIPKVYAAHLETGTRNGPMEIGFPVTVEGNVDLRHLSLDIGGGGPPVRVITTNGPVSVHQE